MKYILSFLFAGMFCGAGFAQIDTANLKLSEHKYKSVKGFRLSLQTSRQINHTFSDYGKTTQLYSSNYHKIRPKFSFFLEHHKKNYFIRNMIGYSFVYTEISFSQTETYPIHTSNRVMVNYSEALRYHFLFYSIGAGIKIRDKISAVPLLTMQYITYGFYYNESLNTPKNGAYKFLPKSRLSFGFDLNLEFQYSRRWRFSTGINFGGNFSEGSSVSQTYFLNSFFISVDRLVGLKNKFI